MPDITDYVSSVSLGTQVSNITGASMDGFLAGGFAAFVQAITGSVPQVVKSDTNKASVILTSDQAAIVQSWLDDQLLGFIRAPAKPSNLNIELGPVIMPWALKYLIPAALLLVLAGWLGHHWLVR